VDTHIHTRHTQNRYTRTHNRYTGAHALLPDALFALSQGCSMISATVLFTHTRNNNILFSFFSENIRIE